MKLTHGHKKVIYLITITDSVPWLFKKVEYAKTYASVLDIIKVIISILLSVNISTIFRISDFEIISKAFLLVKIAASNRFYFERIATFLYNWKRLRKFFWNHNKFVCFDREINIWNVFKAFALVFYLRPMKTILNLTFQV